MAKKLNYCKGIVIAHGKCELLLANHVKSNLHLSMEILSNKNGRNSIQIDGLMSILGNNNLKSPKALKKCYPVEEINGELINFSVIPIMDLDDTSEETKLKYISGEMFQNHWLSPYIVPIWNNRNLDKVLYDLGIIAQLPNDKQKGRLYERIFPKNKGIPDRQRIENLMKTFEKSKDTNLEVFIKICLDNLEK